VTAAFCWRGAAQVLDVAVRPLPLSVMGGAEELHLASECWRSQSKDATIGICRCWSLRAGITDRHRRNTQSSLGANQMEFSVGTGL